MSYKAPTFGTYDIGKQTGGRSTLIDPATYGSVTPQSPSFFSGLMDNPGFLGGLSGISAGLQGYSQQKEDAKSRQMGAAQFGASMAQQQLENSQNNQRSRAVNAAELDPLGASQDFAAKQALTAKLLGGLQNFHSSPGDAGIRAAMGHRTMPSLPQFTAAELDSLYGPAATQASIASRQKAIGQVDPNHSPFDLGTIFGNSADGSENAFMTDIKSSNREALNKQMDEAALTRKAIQDRLAEMQNAAKGPSKKSGFLNMLPSIGLTALSLL